MHYIDSLADLQALFGEVGDASRIKEVPLLHPVYRDWIARAPFAVLATHGPKGMDCSPRGDAAPLVRMPDAHTLLLPERRGNNRIDSLRNLLHDPHAALIFLVPGVNETLRVNGRARICVEPALLTSFEQQGQRPKCVIELQVDTVFFQCARALLRSQLWSAGSAPPANPPLPSPGDMLAALSASFDGAAYDRELPERLSKTLY